MFHWRVLIPFARLRSFESHRHSDNQPGPKNFHQIYFLNARQDQTVLVFCTFGIAIVISQVNRETGPQYRIWSRAKLETETLSRSKFNSGEKKKTTPREWNIKKGTQLILTRFFHEVLCSKYFQDQRLYLGLRRSDKPRKRDGKSVWGQISTTQYVLNIPKKITNSFYLPFCWSLVYLCGQAYSHSFQIVGCPVVINLGFLFFFPSVQPPCAWNIIFTIAFVYNIHDLYRQFRMKVLIQLSLGQWYIRLFKFVFRRFYWFPRKYGKAQQLYTLARLVSIFFSKARNWRSHRVET